MSGHETIKIFRPEALLRDLAELSSPSFNSQLAGLKVVVLSDSILRSIRTIPDLEDRSATKLFRLEARRTQVQSPQQPQLLHLPRALFPSRL